MSNLELDLWWEPREPAQADDARRLSRFVNGLPDFDPVYRSWLASPKTKKESVPVPLNEAEAKQLMIDNMMRYNSPLILGRSWEATSGADTLGLRLMTFARRAWRSRAAISAHTQSMAATTSRWDCPTCAPSTGRPWRASELRPLMKFARDIWNPEEMCAMFSFYGLDLP